MIELRNCLIYIAAVGVAGFTLGRVLPKSWFKYDAPPFRALPFEDGGRFYRRLGIHRWHKLLPDMSRILPMTMPAKRITAHLTVAQAEVMVQETCIAEFIHIFLSFAGLYLPFLWPGPGGVLVFLAYLLLGNVPFILIQRFNRPKLRALLERCRRAEASANRAANDLCEDAPPTAEMP